MFGINDKDYGKTECSDEFGNPCVDVLVCSSIAKCFLDDRALQPGETVVLKVMSTHKTAVMQRESDLLTTQEIRQYEDLVDAAILEELTTWHGHGCFVRQ